MSTKSQDFMPSVGESLRGLKMALLLLANPACLGLSSLAIKFISAVSLCFCIVLSGCSESLNPITPPSVHATSPPPHPISAAHQMLTCPEFAISGNCPGGYVAQESPSNYLALRIGPQVGNIPETEYVYTLPYAMHISQIDGWDDTGYQNVIEHDSHLQFQFPDGSFTEYYIQYDNHSTSLPGEKQRLFNVNLDLPIGTKVIMYHNPVNCISPANQCGYDAIWQMRSH
ncbi:MAG TPA: hypothetical protein VKH81_04175 [Candidatus Angelobacter sp.]|nr:hypothetical protein [Candidatus Angelobacter sp.]